MNKDHNNFYELNRLSIYNKMVFYKHIAYWLWNKANTLEWSTPMILAYQIYIVLMKTRTKTSPGIVPVSCLYKVCSMSWHTCKKLDKAWERKLPVFSGIRLQITGIFRISNLHACKIHACAFQKIRIHAF